MLQERQRTKALKKQQQTQCEICQQQFGVLKGKGFCIFCEQYVCKQHLVKKRKDPLDKEKMHKICNCCEDEILEKMITEKQSKKLDILNEEENQLTEILARQTRELNALQDELSNLKNDQENDDYNQQVERYDQLLKKADLRIGELNDEASQLNEAHRKLLEYKKIIETQKINEQTLLNETKNEEKRIKQELKTLEQEINQIKMEIEKEEAIRKKIPENKDKNNYDNAIQSLQFDSKIVHSCVKQKPIDKKINQSGYWCN